MMSKGEMEAQIAEANREKQAAIERAVKAEARAAVLEQRLNIARAHFDQMKNFITHLEEQLASLMAPIADDLKITSPRKKVRSRNK